MKHLLSMSDLSVSEIHAILDRADRFRSGVEIPQFPDQIAVNLFFEPSTRTQYSFHIAEKRLGMRVIPFHMIGSSLEKNESFYDTVKVFDSFETDVLVIRHSENAYYNRLLGHVNAAIINGGDGTGQHPTQSLLDLMTIRREFQKLEGLTCSIIGDIRHSRVAHTDAEVMRRFGMEVLFCAPPEYQENEYTFVDLETALSTSDIVMLLRVQLERHEKTSSFSDFAKEEYHRAFGLTYERMQMMKPHAIIMHPSPFNRGIEIADEVVECSQSRIFEQMKNGMYVRMAVLERALS